MKFFKPVLSAEQKRVMQAYNSVRQPALIVSMFCLIFVLFPISILLKSYGLSGSSTEVTGMAPISALVISHYWATRKLRMAGSSLESTKVEVVTCVNAIYDGVRLQWRRPNSFLPWIANVIGISLFAVLGGWVWHNPSFSLLIRGLGLVGLCEFSCFALMELIFFRLPFVQIDADGIADCSTFWQRRAHWTEVASCEIRSFYNFLGEGPLRTFTFRSAGGKALLRLTPHSLNGLSRDEQAEIEREIRRRLGHETQN